MEQRLPRSLTYYLEVEAVTEDHVRQATKLLRDIYGQKLLSELFAKEIRQEGSTFVYSPETALALLLEARPEELTSLYVYDMPLPSTVVVEGCRVFADCVSKHNGYVPKWVVAAFWWLSYAVDGFLSVHDLTAAIERWYGRL